jgi:hypothetical protein
LNNQFQSQAALYVAAMLKAITDSSPKDGNGRAVAVPGDIYDAALTIAAYAVAGSNDCATPTKTREFCQGASRALRKRVESVQEGMKSGEIPRPYVRTN